ncbi:BamA/TamA family outer membrane protein [Flammeovirga aprica]|uniref:Bacterial surface antigen (D15) domain-containing protein n=1 Tax=Flammeovirga aprica JL-4 TaxID=694437 RepID=A0A7X9P2R7_9BACT|nr:hypothetical protein [Flammeovirga aprica]NME68350.1 hypothetical protein [Flammeovirga aprica JL-4]
MTRVYYYTISHLLLFLLPCLLGHAQSDSTSQKPYKNNILPSPAFTYSPRTDFVLGVYCLYQFKFNKKDFLTRPSNFNFYYGTSFKGHVFLSTEHTLLTYQEKYFLKGIIEYKNTPEPLYGIGNQSPNEEYLNVNYSSFEFKERVLKQYEKSKFIGLKVRYIHIFDVTYQNQNNESIPPPDIAGNNGGYYPGIGPVWMLDKRNSILTPTKNYYLDLVLMGYLNSNGGTFASLEFDGRRYIDFRKDSKRVLALQVVAKNTFGSVPYNELALLGGKQIMRGYLLGRYRDKHSIQAQAEFRLNVVGRFGMTAFLGTGTVYEEVSDLQYLKAALGTGLRFNINRKDPANVRFDFAWSLTDKNNGIYITLGEAF